MPDKAYAIIHDGTFLLVGRGGRSGDPPTQRPGNHLPGGSVQGNPPAKQVVKEIGEETGFSLAPLAQPFTIAKKSTTLYFFVIRVDSVPGLVKGFERPEITDAYDEPFAEVLAADIEAALGKGFFNAHDWTDWFGDGLQKAFNDGLLEAD